MKLVRVAEPQGWEPCPNYEPNDLNEGAGEPAILKGGRADDGGAYYKLTEGPSEEWYRLDD